MAVVSMKQLLEAGVHFGHQTRRWNPKMQRYIFTQRNGIHIIDLQKTVNGLAEAYEYVRDLSAQGEKMLFVGTKKQAQEAVHDEAIRANQFYVNQRWLGGLLTNFKTIQERLRRLDELERMKVTGEMDLRPKKEQLRLGDEMIKLNRLLGGIRTMRRLPAALFIVDCQKEHLAVHEATRLGIPIVALVDTNADPDPVAYPIPANDDAIRAVRLLAGRIADATIEGQQMRESMQSEAEDEAVSEYTTDQDDRETYAPLVPEAAEGEVSLARDEEREPASTGSDAEESAAQLTEELHPSGTRTEAGQGNGVGAAPALKAESERDEQPEVASTLESDQPEQRQSLVVAPLEGGDEDGAAGESESLGIQASEASGSEEL